MHVSHKTRGGSESLLLRAVFGRAARSGSSREKLQHWAAQRVLPQAIGPRSLPP